MEIVRGDVDVQGGVTGVMAALGVTFAAGLSGNDWGAVFVRVNGGDMENTGINAIFGSDGTLGVKGALGVIGVLGVLGVKGAATLGVGGAIVVKGAVMTESFACGDVCAKD